MVKSNGTRGTVALFFWVMVAVSVVLFAWFVYTVFVK